MYPQCHMKATVSDILCDRNSYYNIAMIQNEKDLVICLKHFTMWQIDFSCRSLCPTALRKTQRGAMFWLGQI